MCVRQLCNDSGAADDTIDYTGVKMKFIELTEISGSKIVFNLNYVITLIEYKLDSNYKFGYMTLSYMKNGYETYEFDKENFDKIRNMMLNENNNC